MGGPAAGLVEIKIDLWALVEPLLPLLEEMDRIEREAAGEQQEGRSEPPEDTDELQ